MKWCKESVLTLLCSFMILSCAKENQCPGGKTICPDDSTCCRLHDGSYGCCPIKNAVCCQDSVHCCPGGFSCDVMKGVCQMGDKSKPLLKKIPAIPNVNEIADRNVVICASGEGLCPPDHSCCSVPGSDKVHCCPGGYSCEEGLCQDSRIRFPATIITSSAAKIVKCNQKFACPERHTCCKVDTSYLCCPLPQAVCCTDHKHCCPRGLKCSSDGKTCSSGVYTLPAISASSPMSLMKGFNKLLHLMMVKFAKRRKSPSVEYTKLSVVKKRPDVNSVICPDGQSECPDGSTCCKLSSGQWGCCPLPKAVCCSDGVHCCPNGYTCDVSEGTCNREVERVPMLTNLPTLKKTPDENNVICPDEQSECPNGNTCCKLSSGQWGCCPLPNAVCCSDGVHCCPNGYTCDVSEGTCNKEIERVPMLTKLPTLKKTPDENSVVCPDGTSECPNGNTCCKLSSGGWGCCPLPKAVCCSDGVHCCPNGYTCDVSEGTCSKEIKSVPMVTKLPALKKTPDENSVVCPDGTSECPDGNTCCKLSSGQWGCCPLPNAVCCSDGVHCCPNGYTCDVSEGSCNKARKSIPMLTKLPALKKTLDENNVICPDGQSECPDGNTCCKLSSGQWGCCPLPNAVCCSDGVHCCPNGYTCDVSEGSCSKGSLSISMFQKVGAVERTSDERAFDGIICPDKKYQCPKGSTCCKLPSGTYGCCPLEDAVCCSDGKHCCPKGYTCDVKEGKCNKTAEDITISNIPVSRTAPDAELEYIYCPDGSRCLDYETCCELTDVEFGCCPLPHAVCCSDRKHCCPDGYRCDVTAGMCVTGNVRLPVMKKMKSPRRPKTDHGDIDDKIHFIPGREQAGDDDAVLWLERP